MPGSIEKSGASILIVDDQPSNVRLLEHTLRRAGYVDVDATTDPLNSAALHYEKRYDLIILDLQMPGMDGFEVMASIREIDGTTPVPVLVMSADPSQRLSALERGATSFLSKPFVLTEVVQCVRVLLEKTCSQEGEERNAAQSVASSVTRASD